MIVFLTIIHVIVCLVLILVILLQAGRGQGLTGPSFGSGNVQSLFGTGAADFLTKATSVCAIMFLFTAIGLGYIESRKSKSLMNFSGRQNTPVDVDAIKKALERVKEESAKKGTDTKQAVTEVQAKAADSAAKAVDTATQAVEQAKTAAAPAVTSAQEAVKAAAATPVPSVPAPAEPSKS